ncbi:unnamed protein product [Penicillium glandicola]
MGVPTQDKNRVIKRKIAPKKLWTEVAREKISPQTIALQEALECTECGDLHINPYMMYVDIAAGSYITSQYPPSFVSKSEVDDNISPFDTDLSAHQNINLTFWEDITDAQEKRYYDKIDSILKRTEVESGKPADEATILFAHYQVDFHIRQHYLVPRSFLNLCRSKHDIIALNRWKWENAVADETAFAECRDWGVGWVHEPSNSIGHQIAAWLMGERKREAHLAEVQARWAEIKDEIQKRRMRTIKISFKGVHVRTCKYEPCEPRLTEEEIMDIARSKRANDEAFYEKLIS